MDEGLRQFGEFMRQNETRKQALISLLVSLYRCRLAILPRDQLTALAKQRFEQFAERTQVLFDPSISPDEAAVEVLVEDFRASLQSRSLLDLTHWIEAL